MEATVYAEAFVELDGYRWRVCESDPGLIEIHYQEWDEAARAWKSFGDNPAAVSFSAEYADALCKAIQRVKAGV
jgi:hypothetical protein